jgi:hypothetical protein
MSMDSYLAGTLARREREPDPPGFSTGFAGRSGHRMRFLTRQECRAWLDERGIDPAAGTAFSGPVLRWSHRVVGDSGKKTALSRTIVSHVPNHDESLFLITAFGVWPSSEDLVLLYGFRQSLGETRTLAEAPGLLFTGKDSATAASMLGMALYFVWGALLLAPSISLQIELSSDEIVDLTFAGNKETGEAIAEGIARILGPPLEPP